MHDPLDDIPNEFRALLGTVTIQWNFLEFLLNLYSIHLLGKEIMESRSHIVFAHMTFPQKMDILGALVEEVKAAGHLHNLELSRYKEEVQPCLRAASTARNSVIHAYYCAKEDGTVTKANITARGQLKFSWCQVNVKEIEHAIQLIVDAKKALGSLTGIDDHELGKFAPRKEDKS